MRYLVTLGYMSVTKTPTEVRDQNLAAVEAITRSQTLHGSESLCKLLRYLAEHALQNPGAALKEYQIATEVFGRPSDFDPHLDSAIRVQAGRLRMKLAEYYSTEGAEEPIVVEFPKGTYALTFHRRTVDRQARQMAPSVPSPRPQPVSNRHWLIAIAVLSFLLVLAVAAIGGLWERQRQAAVSLGPASPALHSLPIFWKAFVAGPNEPWVVFSNAAFVGRPEVGMRYLNPSHDSHALVLDHYTGVGEVLGVHELDRVFHLLHRDILVKRGSLFSLDDAKSNNLIFVGSPAENLTLRDLPSTRQFAFQRLPSGPHRGDLVIMNLHRQSGEAGYFEATPSDLPLSEDYAVIALVPGLDPADSVVILAGLTTIGTQAAVEYVCHEDTLSQLLNRITVSPAGDVKPFEAVLQVKVARGVPVESYLAAVRNEKW
jgi:hypothetical protein